jgi:hypothetical protein
MKLYGIKPIKAIIISINEKIGAKFDYLKQFNS